MKKKEVKKKSDFFKIAQGLGIAIPASLLFATNANATPANIIENKSMQIVENSISLQDKNEVVNRIVWELNTNKKPFDLAAHTDNHTNNAAKHTNNHTNTQHANTHTNRNNGADVCPSHTDSHSNTSGTNSHTNSNTPHSNYHTNKKDNC